MTETSYKILECKIKIAKGIENNQLSLVQDGLETWMVIDNNFMKDHNNAIIAPNATRFCSQQIIDYLVESFLKYKTLQSTEEIIRILNAWLPSQGNLTRETYSKKMLELFKDPERHEIFETSYTEGVLNFLAAQGLIAERDELWQIITNYFNGELNER